MFLINIRLNKFVIATLENGGTLKSVPDCYKNPEMCNKVVDNYPHALEFVPQCFMTQKMCDKVFKKCFLYLIQFLIDIKLKKCVKELFLKIKKYEIKLLMIL